MSNTHTLNNTTNSTHTQVAQVANIPDMLAMKSQWMVSKFETRDNGKRSKPPCDSKGFPADKRNPDNWLTFYEAVHIARAQNFDAIGFCLTSNDPLCVIDLDDCFDPATGQLTDKANALVKSLNSYTEISPSGKGLHIFVEATVPANRNKAQSDGIEIYDKDSFITVTGNRLPDTPATIAPRQAQIQTLYAALTPKPPPTPIAYSHSSLTTQDVIAAGLKYSPIFQKYWRGRCGGNKSEEDQAFCGALAWLTANDPVLIDQVFRESPLMRGKWTRNDYRERTMNNAMRNCQGAYNPNAAGPDTSQMDWSKINNRQLGTSISLPICPSDDQACPSDDQACPSDDQACPSDDGLEGAVRASNVAPEKHNWLWEYRLIIGALNVLQGDPDVGKSVITIDLIARVTTGRNMPLNTPNGYSEPKGAVIWTFEDDAATTIVPRLIAAGADLSKVIIRSFIRTQDGTCSLPQLPANMDRLVKDIEMVDAGIVAIDPVLSFLGSKVDSYRAQDVSAVLNKLDAVAKTRRLVMLALNHLTKDDKKKALYRAQGSEAFISVARSVLQAARNNLDPENGHRTVSKVKGNLAGTLDTVTYQTTTKTILDLEDNPIEAVVINWIGTTGQSADEALDSVSSGTGIARAIEFYKVELADGEVLSGQVTVDARDLGITVDNLKDAREVLGIKPYQSGGKWFQKLPMPEQVKMSFGVAA